MSYLDISRLPGPLRILVESELQSGERMVWMGQPLPGRVARATLPMVLFGIPWTGFALFWTGMAFWGTQKADNAGWFRLFPLFGLPFVVLGFGFLSSPYWARRKARNTVYVVTDRRAILFEGGWRGGVTIRSFGPSQLDRIERHQRPDGSGDLIFDRAEWRDSDGDRRSRVAGFLELGDVKEVEEYLRRLTAPAGL